MKFAKVILVFMLLMGKLVQVQAGDVFEYSFSANAKRIFKWPGKKKFDYKLLDQDKVLAIDAHETSGIVGLNLPEMQKGKYLEYVEFTARTVSGSRRDKLTIIVRDADKEQYSSGVKLKPEWQQFRVDVAGMKYFKFGSKFNDGKLDSSQIRSLVFSCYPAGIVFQVKNLKMGFVNSAVTPASPPNISMRKIEIKEIKMPETERRDYQRFPAQIGNVTIKGNSFLRDGTPTFLLGGWQLDCSGPGWIMRTLAIDVMVYNATEIYTLYPPRQSPGKLTVEWKPNIWYEAVIERLLNNGIMFWHEQKAEARYCPLKKYKEFSDLIDAGHFVTYDPYHPLGEKCYREMYKSWMRHTKKYPMFCYEIFNEMVYDNTHLSSRQKFQKEMSARFGSIKKANAAWGTHFSSFAEVQPPGFIQDGGKVANAPRGKFRITEAAKYPNLQIDWQKFQERRSYDAVKKLMPAMRSYDPDPRVFSTLQSHLNLYLDYSNIGIKPEMLVDFSDFYSHECGLGFLESDDPDNVENIMKMLRTSLINDFVRGVCPDKPIFNAESPIHIKAVGVPEDELQKSDLAGLNGCWKFYDATKKIVPDWFATRFNDASWHNIKVPGTWGTQGFPNCKLGLYRKTFSFAPGKAKERRVYLNGKAFSDDAEIYLNGKKLGEAHGYRTKFSFDVTSMLKENNTLAVKISNKYFSEGMYHGGIRGMVSLNYNFLEPATKAELRPKHFRSFLWSQFIHGMKGVMVCYQSKLFVPAARYLPSIKQELETAIPLLQHGKVIDAQAAVVYPQETFRAIIHRDYFTKLKIPATMDLLRYYVPMLFSRTGIDVIRNVDLIKLNSKKYRLIVMPGNIRISKTELDALKRYVKNGGIVIADFGSLSIDDESHEKLDTSDFLGLKVTSMSKNPITLAGNNVMTDKRFIDGNTHARIICGKAKATEKFTDGSPAVIVNSYGNGKVYYIGGLFPFDMVSKILKNIMLDNEITPQIELKPLKGKPVPAFVEANLAGRDGCHVLYLLNWGGEGGALTKLRDLPASDYVIRNLETANILKSPSGNDFWSAAEIAAGIPLKLASLDPVTLLFEQKDLKPTLIRGISPARYNILNQLWVAPENKNNKAPVVAISPIDKHEVFGDIPTARRVLTDNGYKVINHHNGKTSSEKIDVLVWYYSRLRPTDTKDILNFVRNGGGLLICGTGLLNYHHKTNNSLTKALKLGQNMVRSNVLYAGRNSRGLDMLSVICRDIDRQHPVGAGISSFITSCAGSISHLPHGAKTVISAPSDSSLAGQPLLSVFKYGKGRVVFIADYWWLRPLHIEKGDNVQLWFNIINYLARRPVKILTPKQRKKSLFITSETLSRAEKEEAEKDYIFKPLSNRKSYLQESVLIQGIKGKDPIIDMLEI